MTVEKYVAKYIELARFALYLIPNEESKTKKFQEGLQPRIREKVSWGLHQIGECLYHCRERTLGCCCHDGAKETTHAPNVSPYKLRLASVGSGSR